MTVKSADKKPEKYVAPDGKTKIRMVPMDKEVVKSEAYDEPQGQAKRMMSPLQKVRMDKEKADRDGDGKLKSTNKTLKALRKEQVKRVDEVSADKLKRYVDKNNQQANKPMKITSNPNDMKKQTRTMDKRLRGKRMAVDKMLKMYGRSGQSARVSATEEVKQVDEVSKGMVGRYLKKVPASAAHAGDRTGTGGMGQAGASADVKKGYEKQRKKGISQFIKRQKGTDMAVDKLTGKAKVPAKESIDEISKKTAQSYLDKTKSDDAFSGTRKANNRLKGAIHAVGKLRKEESVDEVLDTPKAMDSYHNKAKTQSDRARNSATAKIVRGTKDISKEKDVIRKREKGMDMAANARIKQFRKSIGKGYAGAVKEDLNPYHKHPANKLKDKHASFSRQIGDLQTKKLKGAKNPSIDQEIAKYQQKLRHVKNAMKSEATIQNEAGPKKKKYLTYKDMKKAIASIKPSKKKPTLPKAPWDKKDD
tara:strand:- start:5244 stop:6671 length:1428 start_codon:yes stop_codon:yes gene_type:complete